MASIKKKRGVLAFGEIAIDHCLFVDDSFLAERNIPKGSVIPYNEKFNKELLSSFPIEFSGFGGSSINSAKGLVMLGHRAGVLSCYGDDILGEEMAEDIQAFGLENLVVVREGVKSGECIGCVHQDALRTMYGMFDSKLTIHVDEVDWDKVKSFEYILFEGFQFGKFAYDEILEELIKKARRNKQKIAFLLSDMFWVPTYRDRVLEFIQGVSIISGNENEFQQLFDKYDREKLLSYLETLNFELIAVTMGNEGAYIIHDHKRLFVPIEEEFKAIDTVGAGDYFASGMIYAYINGYSVEACGKVGAMLSGSSVTMLGNNPSKDIIPRIHEYLKTQKK